jgi:hypothetical protein
MAHASSALRERTRHVCSLRHVDACAALSGAISDDEAGFAERRPTLDVGLGPSLDG